LSPPLVSLESQLTSFSQGFDPFGTAGHFLGGQESSLSGFPFGVIFLL
jgi:hypothetical protein